MFTRQQYFKSIIAIAKQQSMNSKTHRNYQDAHHLFDRSPHPKVGFNNHPMLACLSRNRPFEALKLFREQLQLGIIGTINEVNVAIALKACRGDTKSGFQIHGYAISSGLDSFLTVSNSLMNMYCKSGQFDQAFLIFENLHDADIVSWNTILSGFHQSEDAIKFALKMHLSGVFFDAVTYTTLLAFCSNIQEFHLGSQLHSQILIFGFGSEIFIGNALITMYSRWGHLDEAKRMFDEMPNRDLVSWNALLSGYTQEGNYGVEAIGVFAKMVKEGMELDHVSFASVVSACSHERSLELGQQIHGLIIRTGYGTEVSICNVLISMYAKCELLEHAKMVFEGMIDRNVVSWTTSISINEEDAFSLFKKMREDEVYPNDVTFVGLINVVSKNNLTTEGKMIHGFCIKTGFLSELNVSNSFITMYSKFESMEESTRVFDEQSYREIISWNALISGYAQNRMYLGAFQAFVLAIQESHPNEFTFGSVLSAIGAAEPLTLRHGQRCHSTIIKLGLKADPIVSGALLDMYAKCGSIEESQWVFNEAPERSKIGWTAIISAHARHGDYRSVMNLFEEMEKKRITPDSVTFLAVLTACSRSGMVETGCQVFQSMINDHFIEPSPEHYSCVVDMLGRAGRLEEAEEFVNQMPITPGISVWQSLLGACRIHGNVKMAKRAAEALLEIEPMESGSYVLICNLYAEKGDWDKVAEIRKGMRQRRVKKEVGFSWVDLGDGSMCMHGFSSNDKSHHQVEEIYKMVECIGLEMRILKREAERT